MVKKFLRRTSSRYIKLGSKQKKKQTWRKPKGRDNKMREKKKGYPKVVSIGYQKQKDNQALVKGKIPTIVQNTKDLEKITKNEMVVLGKIGKKKKIEIVKKAKEMKIEIHNLNVKRFLKKLDKKGEKKTEDKKESKPEVKKQETKKWTLERKKL